jgi:hypothetical protein
MAAKLGFRRLASRLTRDHSSNRRQSPPDEHSPPRPMQPTRIARSVLASRDDALRTHPISRVEIQYPQPAQATTTLIGCPIRTRTLRTGGNENARASTPQHPPSAQDKKPKGEPSREDSPFRRPNSEDLASAPDQSPLPVFPSNPQANPLVRRSSVPQIL